MTITDTGFVLPGLQCVCDMHREREEIIKMAHSHCHNAHCSRDLLLNRSLLSSELER